MMDGTNTSSSNRDQATTSPSDHPPNNSPKITTAPGADYIHHHTAVLARAFATDPAITYMLSTLSPARRAAYQPTYMQILLRASMLNRGIFVEAGDFASVAVWMPPGERVDNEWTILQAGFLGLLWNLGWRGAWKMLVEYSGQAERIKGRELVDVETGGKLKRWHYLWFVGTEERERGRGLASALIRAKQRAVGEGVEEERAPIWLEATTVRSREVYARCGFKTVGEVRLGVGTHGSDGLPAEGGEGVGVWAMIWRPEWDVSGGDGKA